MEPCKGKMTGRAIGFLLMISLLVAQPLSSQTKDLVYDLSVAQFQGADSLAFVEFYFSIPLNQLVLVPNEESYKLGFSLMLEAAKDDSVFSHQEFSYPYTTSGEEKELQQNILSVQNMYLPAGKFEITVQISDLFGENVKKVNFPLNAVPVPRDSLYLSDIQLASLIEQETEKTQFYKNGYKVLPNVLNVFGTNLPALFYYSEIYNLDRQSPADTSSYLVNRRILSTENQIIKSLPPKIRKKPGASAVELGRVSIATLNSGTYIFEVEVQDLGTKRLFRRAKKFFIYRPQDFAAGAGPAPVDNTSPGLFPDSRYDTMTEHELDVEFETAKYISAKDEQNTYKKLNLDAKRRFLVEFWARRDTDITTKKNELRDTYLSRVKESNEQFAGFKEGWRSDRGRVFIMYGPPDDIERSPFASESKPYQIWHYYSQQGGIQFVFVDKRNFGDLELVHSTARGELNDTEWQRWINTID